MYRTIMVHISSSPSAINRVVAIQSDRRKNGSPRHPITYFTIVQDTTTKTMHVQCFFRVVGHCAILYGSDQQLKLQLMFNCIAILHPRRRIASQIHFNCSAVWRLVQRFLGFSVGLIDDATNAPDGVMIT